MKKIIAFLRKTPSYAQQQNCGQFNGYIGIPKSYADKMLADIEYDEDGWPSMYQTLYDRFEGPVAPNGGATYGEYETINGNGSERFPIYPITDIEPGDYLVIGFDTCHIHNSWDHDTYDSVKADTEKWLYEVTEWSKKFGVIMPLYIESAFEEAEQEQYMKEQGWLYEDDILEFRQEIADKQTPCNYKSTSAITFAKTLMKLAEVYGDFDIPLDHKVTMNMKTKAVTIIVKGEATTIQFWGNEKK